MTELAPFQRATVDAAARRLSGDRPRRFLVADEVGLGKTVIARAVAEQLKGRSKRFNVMYLCPSLEIAGQNRPKFVSLTGIEEKAYLPGGDRLALVPGSPPSEANGYRIFAFTPETSLPGWKPGPRTGRKAERCLIRSVLARYPDIEEAVLALDAERDARPLLEDTAALDGFTYVGIDRALRDVFACGDGEALGPKVTGWLQRGDTGLAEFIARARSALALATLRSKTFRPDLVILDEFHRYADLILPRPVVGGKDIERERAAVHRLLVDELTAGPEAPALLLLSATPYRLRRLDGEELHAVEHYRALIDLAGFLTDDQGARQQVEEAMRAYHDALLEPDPEKVRTSLRAAKQRIETILQPVVSRTERALVHEEDLFDRPATPVVVEPEDLRVFRHFAKAACAVDAKWAGWTPAMWSSIPYPTQTLHGYALWPKLRHATGQPALAGSGRGQLAHPQLRKLAEIAGDPRQLTLPWQPPTAPWWRLEGPWSAAKRQPGKTLLFSRWKAAPTAISALLSLQITGGMRKPGSKPPVPLLRPGGGEAGPLLGLFMQWPTLSHAIEPTKTGGGSIRAVRTKARDDLRQFLEEKRITLTGKGKRATWLVACALERHLSRQGFNRMKSAVLIANTGRGGLAWDDIEATTSISPGELLALADLLISSPGAIVARCARRHSVPFDTAKEARAVFAFAWGRLRSYLGHRTFADTILSASDRKRYPDALCDAMLKGGFEAVLDEQMGILGQLGDAKGLQIIDRLSASLMDRPGLVRLRRGKADARIPVQAVVPFSGGEQRRTSKGKGGKLRSDGLRQAFNSPFWPHILCTTSVGQEGLDFHLWCRRLVHWDLPSDPVDFEQREGRIARYGSLAVRQSLASAHGRQALAEAKRTSPFLGILRIAREQPAGGTGLERWWLPANGRPESISFDWKFSLRSVRKERMLKDLLLYRLALGQPEPDAFVKMLRRIDADAAEARSLAICLAAISRVDAAAPAVTVTGTSSRLHVPSVDA